ncbi:DsbA family protein [Pseudosulfitobacter sp. SM2401]|jgi:protein-disulfide isomerase|uniref:DsbA family protein n=1 Tax=Pseudosulfitobacter sp. SM2401 TaxID=3350098 RepID=UPI002A287BCB|nr:DsbA family protein [Ascidiaceihabitans sp.]
MKLKTWIAAGLVSALALPAAALDIASMTAQERQLFRDEVRAYLMDNPQVIIEAVNLLEDRQAEQQAQADINLVSDNADDLFNDGYSYVGGNPDGDITLVEFLDYRCGYCRKAHTEVAKMLETDGNIRLIVKEFPILGEQSVMASRFAVAVKQVAGNEAYKNVNDAMMTLSADINMPTLTRLANTFGLDMVAIAEAMNGPDVADEIAKTRALAQKLRITGTPTFVLQDELLRGYLPYDQMMRVVSDKRS